MTQKDIIAGFIKRASQYGVPQDKAILIAKEAGLFDAPDPNNPSPGIWDMIKDQARLAMPGGQNYYSQQLQKVDPNGTSFNAGVLKDNILGQGGVGPIQPGGAPQGAGMMGGLANNASSMFKPGMPGLK